MAAVMHILDVVDEDSGQAVAVYFTSTFSMTCACMKQPWCDHRQTVITTSADASLVHSILVMEKCEIEVPIFPTRHQYLYGEIERLSTTTNLKFTRGETFCGVVGPGEGMGAMRSMVLSQLESIAGNPGERLICQSDGHRYSAQRELESRIKHNDKAWLLANDFSILSTTFCMKCREGEVDFSDLVPDLGTESRFVPW